LGVKTGEAIWEAKKKCPGLVAVQADFKKYIISRLVFRGETAFLF